LIRRSNVRVKRRAAGGRRDDDTAREDLTKQPRERVRFNPVLDRALAEAFKRP
jgi:hypothetical protein